MSATKSKESFHYPQLLKNLDLNKISWQITVRDVAVTFSSILTCVKSLALMYFPFFFLTGKTHPYDGDDEIQLWFEF